MDLNNKLSELRVFHYSARALSMTAAAKQLCVTQPAVTHSIKELEAALGCRLFTRINRKINLTAEGELLYSSTRKIFAELEQFQKKLDRRRGLDGGVLFFSATQMIVRYFLMSYMTSFHADYPSVQFKVQSSSKRETIRLIENGLVDFGFLTTPLEPGESGQKLNYEKLAEITDVFITSSSDYVLGRQKLSFEQLIAQPLITLRKSALSRRYQEQYFSQYGFDLNPSIECDNLDLIIEFAEAGFGVGWITDNVLKSALKQGRKIKKVEFSHRLPTREIGVVYHPSRTLSLCAEKFIERIRQGNI